ncbi:tyrosine-type recombinase/integrase [Rickettsia endosymbiont of Aspidapion aeneum]|uniref:tyrosine-type recombinase/integrase n=2 Tax=unclassified Rickettsia TaxID=114295 RepID=UPI0039795D00
MHTAENLAPLLSMAWEDIDWRNKIWNIPDIKNGKSRSLFLTDEAIEILYRRKQKSKNPWVFPSLKSETGHLVQPQPAWDRIVEKARLKGLTIDDLRKTMEKLIEQLRASIKIL